MTVPPQFFQRIFRYLCESITREKQSDSKNSRFAESSNNTALLPLTVAVLYKSRWQVELFFKWIKQHLRIKRFIANCENAVRSLVWCAVATYVLMAIVKNELKLEAPSHVSTDLIRSYSSRYSREPRFQDLSVISIQK
jgi:IS4 transposase